MFLFSKQYDYALVLLDSFAKPIREKNWSIVSLWYIACVYKASSGNLKTTDGSLNTVGKTYVGISFFVYDSQVFL